MKLITYKNMRKLLFANDEIYHIYNRSVEKRNIFQDEDKKDYFRFVHDLFEFNDTYPAENIYYKKDEMGISQFHETGTREIGKYYGKKKNNHKRELLIEILTFCLMPNHFHLMVRQLREGGITDFMHKLGLGYALYFNKKYFRGGTLWQGRFKAVLVDRQEYFEYLPYYIHLNPLDLIDKGWREGKLKNYNKAIKFLEKYRWSSHLDYAGKKNFPSVTSREYLTDYFGRPEKYKKGIQKRLKSMTPKDWQLLEEVIIE